MMDQMTPPADTGAGQPMPEQQSQSAPMPTNAQPASTEEQSKYNEIVGSSFNMIYDKKMLPKIKKILEGGGDPKAGLARAASLVMTKIFTSVKKSGQEINGDILFHAGTEIFEDLAELSKEAGIFDFSQNPDDLEGAYFLTLDKLRTDMQDAGQLNTEAAKADFAALQQMDATGELEQMFNSLAAADEGGENEPKPPMGAENEPNKAGGLMQGSM